MKVKTTKVYTYLEQNPKSIVAFQGSSRASKTYNILLWLILQSTNWDKKTISIVRQTLPALKASAERDFFEILNNLGIYDPALHNKTDRTYYLNGNLFEFFSCDQEMKVRGRKRNILFVNEANELKHDTWVQLQLRTKELTIIDYNPSHEFHWIYDDVLPRNDCQFYKVTYKDNPFLEQRIVNEIEKLKETNENLWRIFGLGERGVSTETIFTHYKLSDNLPKSQGTRIYGLDFGFNHPTALVEIIKDSEKYYAKEMLYQDKLTTSDLIKELKKVIENTHLIYADYSRPEIISELRSAGFQVLNAKKQVLKGIDFVKSCDLYIDKNSTNLIAELKSYSWKKTRQGIVLDEVIKFKDDAVDALRYAIFSHFGNISGGSKPL